MTVKRTLLLAFLDDPYVAIYAKQLYENWKDEVDDIRIYVSGEQSFIVDYIVALWADIGTTKYQYKLVPHGECLNHLYAIKDIGNVLITLDSDNFIYKTGVINELAKCVEAGEYDCVGSLNEHGGITPFMTIISRKVIENITVDFRPIYRGEQYMDTMQVMSEKITDTDAKVKVIPVDSEGKYEHIGRMAAFPIMLHAYPDEPKEIDKSVTKAFSRASRVRKIKEIFTDTMADFPYQEYNDYYAKMLELAQL